MFYAKRNWKSKDARPSAKIYELADRIGRDMRQIAYLYDEFVSHNYRLEVEYISSNTLVRQNLVALEDTISTVRMFEDGKVLDGKKRNVYHLLVRFARRVKQFYPFLTVDHKAAQVGRWFPLLSLNKDEIHDILEIDSNTCTSIFHQRCNNFSE